MKRVTSSLMVLFVMLASGCKDPVADNSYTGYVEADWRYLSAPTAGLIDALHVREGDALKTGGLLAELDAVKEQAEVDETAAQVAQRTAQARNLESGARSPELLALEARLDEALARLARVEADRNRIAPLVERGLEPRSRGEQLTADVDAARATVAGLREDIEVARLAGRPAEQAAAQAALAMAEASHTAARFRLAQRAVLVPSSGRVESVLLREGEFAAAGAPIVAFLPDGALKVRFFVPQSDIAAFALDDVVQVSADGLSGPVAARVSFIASDAEFTPPVIYSQETRDKLVFMVEADLPVDTVLSAGIPVDVRP